MLDFALVSSKLNSLPDSQRCVFAFVTLDGDDILHRERRDLNLAAVFLVMTEDNLFSGERHQLTFELNYSATDDNNVLTVFSALGNLAAATRSLSSLGRSRLAAARSLFSSFRRSSGLATTRSTGRSLLSRSLAASTTSAGLFSSSSRTASTASTTSTTSAGLFSSSLAASTTSAGLFSSSRTATTASRLLFDFLRCATTASRLLFSSLAGAAGRSLCSSGLGSTGRGTSHVNLLVCQK